MRVARHTSATATGGFVLQLKAEREDERHDPSDKGLPIVKQLKVGRFILEIDGDRAVVPRLCRGCAQGVTPRSSGVVSGWDTMGVTHWNLKTIVQSSGRHH
jgi:hypothetical protein